MKPLHIVILGGALWWLYSESPEEEPTGTLQPPEVKTPFKIASVFSPKMAPASVDQAPSEMVTVPPGWRLDYEGGWVAVNDATGASVPMAPGFKP